MNYPPNNVVFVNAQPKQYDIHSNFGMFPGERLLYHGEMETGYCEGSSHYYTSVTDTRYVSRNVQFICCCQQPVIDTCIYLNDITELREVRGDTACSNWCCEDCCQCWPCLCCCRLMIPKRLQFRGSFGSHTTHIYRNDQADFELMITEAIAQHKLLN
jgi:hypothetical protein